MRDLVRAGKKNPLVRSVAVQLTEGLPQKDWSAEVRALHSFVRDRIRYLRDVRGVETLHTPERILEQRAGDCDDKSILLAALLESIGHPARLRAVSFQPGRFAHVLVETRIGDKWVPLETTEPVRVGWQPRRIVNNMIIHV
jgi:transglutaminase-like putative cysteine protease